MTGVYIMHCEIMSQNIHKWSSINNNNTQIYETLMFICIFFFIVIKDHIEIVFDEKYTHKNLQKGVSSEYFGVLKYSK